MKSYKPRPKRFSPRIVNAMRSSVVFTAVGKKKYQKADPRHYLNSYIAVDNEWPKCGFWTDAEMAEMCHS